MNLDVGCPDGTPDYAEPVPDQDLDWTWPAADTFTDDSIARWTVHTCSELGSQRIRLIKIRPGRLRDTIKCDTRVCFLSEAGEYTALSYTWGCPVRRCHIIVDEKPRLLTMNLWRFLWQARQLPEHFSGWLWIDAISIEQSDPWEKLEQVKMIPKIFGSAHPVVVWLGQSYGNSDKAMEVLATQAAYSPPWKTPRRLWASPTGPAMLELCNRPYWRRLWIFQELKASRATNLLCGSEYVYFESLMGWLSGNEDERVGAKVQALRDSSAGRMLSLIHASMDSSLRAMLDSTSHLRCTDPRDRVYAILNAVSSGHQGIEADYTATLPDLMNHVLRNMHATEKPRSLLEVGMQCSALEAVLGMSPGSLYENEVEALAPCSDPPFQLSQANLYAIRSSLAGRSKSPFRAHQIVLVLEDMRFWCKRHKHQQIARMIRQELPKMLLLDEPDLELSKASQDFLASGDSAGVSETSELCGKMGRALKSFESICGEW
ncbi:hypothetical protein MBLNU13_g02987t1 [Cladosporium sp. NU13]